MSHTDPHNLQRFLDAQHGIYETVLAELRAGRKRTHWMWFIFPQVIGLGHSPMSRRYAIRSRAEAAAYLAHPVLGARLRECTQAVLQHPNRAIGAIFGYPDDLKFHSCMTLFARLTPPESLFQDALHLYFDGQPDKNTLAILDNINP